MLFSLRSRALFLASIAASVLFDGPVTETSPVFDLAEPVVADDPVVTDDPDELAVPALLVPGGGATIFAELPAPLGSLPELLRPPTLAGPGGTPLTPAVPAPGEPGIWRTHDAAGASRRPARGTARAAAAATSATAGQGNSRCKHADRDNCN